MRLLKLKINAFKNLRGFDIDFDRESPYTVLVGENGAGKSNLIEALTLIFRNLDLDIEAPFTYSIEYRCRDRDIFITAIEDKFPLFQVKGPGDQEYRNLTRRRFMAVDQEERPLFRPAFVFGYYSGPSDRLACMYERHRERYYKLIIKPRSQRRRKPVDTNSLRRMFCAQTMHGQFALLAFFMQPPQGPDDDRSFLREHLFIDGLDSILFALKRPPWRRAGGDPRFWNAEGEVREFLNRLYEAAVLPARMERRISVELRKNPSVECLYLFLPQPEALEGVYSAYQNQYAFFTALESTHISKVLGEVRTRVKLTGEAGGCEVTYRDLSEGEQQLLLVLGLLRFTAEDETLFLLDEPDTHLNPRWSVQYLDFLNRFIKHPESCHIVMSTHDPLVFSRLKRPQVRIMRRAADARVIAEVPAQDPRGMGVAAILTSDLFRLRSTLDPDTQAELDEWRELSVQPEPLNDSETSRLRELSLRLRRLGLTQALRDPLYEKFMKAWTEHEDPAWNDTIELTQDQLEARNRLSEEIVRELLPEEAV